MKIKKNVKLVIIHASVLFPLILLSHALEAVLLDYSPSFMYKYRPFFPYADAFTFVTISAILMYLLLKKFIKKMSDSEESLKESNRRFAVLVNNMKGMVYQCSYDIKRTMNFVSSGALDLTGYHPAVLIDENEIHYGELVHSQDREKSWGVIEKAVSQKMSFELSYRILTGDRQVKWVWEQGSAIFADDGSVEAIEGIITDITEQKRAEARVDEIYAIVNASPVIVCLWKNDPGWQVEAITENIQDLCGYTAEEILAEGFAYTDIVYPDDIEVIYNEVLGYIKSKQVSNFRQEYRLIAKDGTVKWVEDHTLIRRNDEGRITHFQGILFDITDKKYAEEDLLKQKELLQSIMDNIPLLVAFSDAEGAIKWANRTWEETLGWDLNEVQSRKIMSDLYPDPDYRHEVIHAINNSSGQWHTFKTTKRDGSVLDTFWTNIVLSDGSNISMGQDVTDLKKDEKRRRELEEQLIQSQKMEAVGRLAGGVAHDFNNLLSVIIGYADLVLQKIRPDGGSREQLIEILEAAERAKNLTRQLLAFGRKQMLEVKVIDVNDVILSFEKLLRRILSEAITITHELSNEPCLVKADVSQLEQILMNLSINARDAMPEGGELSIETKLVQLDQDYSVNRPEVIPGTYIMISISDTGQGMDKQTLDNIFEPFFTTKSEERGTGLGLSTVYGIVKQHNGHIWVYSEPGLGTTFRIYIPGTHSEGETKETLESSKTGVHSGAVVLIVEDDESVRKLVFTILKNYGYKVIESANVTDAIRIAGEIDTPIDLLLTDVVMPGMKGPEVYERIKELHPETKVLYMSGYTENVIFKKGFLLEGIEFIQKPFSIKALTDKVESLLNK